MHPTDTIANSLRSYAQNVLVVTFGLLPLLFMPSALAPFEYVKILIVMVGLAAALILYSLSILRAGTVAVRTPIVLLSLWAVVFVATFSALLSGDMADSLVGDVMSTHSAAFLALLALTTSLWAIFGVQKAAVMRLYILLAGSALVLVVFHIARLIFGADALSLGVFGSNISTPVGSWNDLALFLSLTVLLSLVAIEQLPLTKSGRSLFMAVTVLALFMLGVINFSTVWLVLGLVSLVLVVYSLGKDRLSGSQLSLVTKRSSSAPSLVLALIVFVVSTLFVIGGAELGGFIAKHTNISYVEVRPSLEATADIARAVYSDNAVLGIGPNKFIDAWRLYKDNSINATVFWNTDFNAGNGYVTSFFITAGILGGAAWLLFLLWFAIQGARSLLTATDTDRMWYFIAVSSYVSALYVWGMSLVYVPGPTILMLGALFTGIALMARAEISGRDAKTLSIAHDRRTGFVFTLVVIVVIVGSVATLYRASMQYAAVHAFNESVLVLERDGDIGKSEELVARAFQLSPRDVYARRMAELQLLRIGSLIAVPEPTQEQRDEFQRALIGGIEAAKQATALDATESANWAVLGNVYAVLFSANIEGSYAEAKTALENARTHNPRNPIPHLALAELEGRAGNLEPARTHAQDAIQLKPNYTNALFFLSQLDIAAGNVEGAIATTQSIISLEPQNAARYFQLGVLELSRQNNKVAIQAFEQAVALDGNYANARYLLALTYDVEGNSAGAREQLARVLELNPGNAEVTELIRIIDTTGSLAQIRANLSNQQPIAEPTGVVEEGGTVGAEDAPDSRLVKPVNTPPVTDESTSSPAPSAGAGGTGETNVTQ